MQFNRTANAKKSIGTGFIVKAVALLLPFISRTIIIRTLGALYAGLGSLFSSVLTVLNLADLGIGSAIVFAMYKPIAEDDEEKIRALMNFYRVAYYVIGSVILTAGLVVMPFLPRLINGSVPEDINLYLLFGIFLGNSVLSYFFLGYKSNILTALQRQDVVNLISASLSVVQYGVQILVLVLFKNYYAYVIVLPVVTLIKDIVLAIYVDKKYPQYKPKGKIDAETRKVISKKTGALIGHKVGDIVLNSIDSIVLSSFLGLAAVTVFDNYLSIAASVEGILIIFFSSLSPIIGNTLVTKSREENYELFNKVFYFNGILLVFCCTCFVGMYQPFITVWVGEEYLYPMASVFLIAGMFFAKHIRRTAMVFKDAAGMWEKDFFKPYLQSAVDLIVDLIFVQLIGANACFLSTLVADLFVAYAIETVVVFKNLFKGKGASYLLNSGFYLLVSALSCAATYFLCSLVPSGNEYLTLLYCTLISIGVSLAFILAFTTWKKEFKGLAGLVLRRFHRKNENHE